ncbi:MAG: 2-oxoacid:acceptor oxidoreductase family protein [Spirochaetales bacterium]|nr:2-oxoacid:acceptor oxidoreductase family protein [Spirochaetales bacterium]
MLHEKIIFAGFGGQGVISAGKLLAIAAMKEGKEVSHIPSYGAEMRGGTANCAVVIADDPIASAIVHKPTICIVLNEPSLDKFEPLIQEGGVLIYNSSKINRKPVRTDITVYEVPCNDISESNGSIRAANMAAIGALLKVKPKLASLESMNTALYEGISERNHKHNPINIKVIEEGYKFIN